MRIPLPLPAQIVAPFLLLAPVGAQDYLFQIKPDLSQSIVDTGFGLDLPGTLIGNFDPNTNPDGTRTLPGFFGGSGNQPISSDFGLGGVIDSITSPSGGFGMSLAPDGGTLAVDGLELDLFGGDEVSSELILSLEFETFRTFNPDSLYVGGFPVDLPIGGQTIKNAQVVQSAGSEAGVLVPGNGEGAYSFAVLVPVELSFTLVALEQETPIGPLPLLLPLVGTVQTNGDLAEVSFGFLVDETQVIDDPLPGFELTDVPLDLPTVLPPGDIANLLLNAVIASLSLDVGIEVNLFAAGEAPCGFETYCVGNPNSTGVGAELVALGSPSIGEDDLTFIGSSLPAEQFTYLMMAAGRAELPFRNSQGLLCLDMPVLLFTPHVVPTGPMGEMSLEVDFDNLPPGISIVAGDTWDFQLWYRDVNQAQQNAGGQQTTNTSNGVEVVFCP
jgi:hypothetical protein